MKKVVTGKRMMMVATSAMMLTAAFALKSTDVSAAGDYKLVWSDEFTGTELNRDNWTPLIGNGGTNPGWGNNELEYYQDSSDNIKVSNGTLKIIAKEQQVTSENEYKWNSMGQLEPTVKTFDYTSARMVTSGKASFQYGKLEARIKLPSLSGIWPAFWMMGYNDKGWPYCGEIDILETWNADNFVQGAWHWFNDNKPNQELWTMYKSKMMRTTSVELTPDGTYTTTRPWSNFDKTQWHTYGIIWDKEKIRFTVDDHILYVQDVATDKTMSEANVEYYFLLNRAVGGNLPGVAPAANMPNQTMEVDYVRVYQQEGTGSKCSNSKWADADKKAVKKFTVSIDGKKATMMDGETLTLPTLKKAKYLFDGYVDQNGKKVESGIRVRSNLTIKSKWVKVKVDKASAKLTAMKKALGVKVTCKGLKGIEVKYSLKKNMKGAKTKSLKGKSLTLTKLKSKKTYYVKVRAYKLDSKKNKVWGKWSKVVYKETK